MTTEATVHVAGYRHGRVPRAVREQQLLDLAERLFTDNGYAAFSIEDLCRAANVSRPIVYDHFGSKDGIFLACLRRIRDEFEQLLIAAATNAPDATSAITQGADAYFAIVERDPQRWSLVYGGATVLAGQLFELRVATIDRIADIARRFAPHAKPQAVTAFAHFISGAGEQLGRWWLHNPTVPRRRVVAHFVSFTGGALATLSPPERAPAR